MLGCCCDKAAFNNIRHDPGPLVVVSEDPDIVQYHSLHDASLKTSISERAVHSPKDATLGSCGSWMLLFVSADSVANIVVVIIVTFTGKHCVVDGNMGGSPSRGGQHNLINCRKDIGFEETVPVRGF
jgi:hypothetical protein